MSQTANSPFLQRHPLFHERRRPIQAILPPDNEELISHHKGWTRAIRLMVVAAALISVKGYYDYQPVQELSVAPFPGYGAALYRWLGFYRVSP